MAREDLARDSKLDDGRSSSRFAGTTAGTPVRPGATVGAATATEYPTGASASARAPADARSSTDAARTDFSEFAFAAEGGLCGV